MAQRRAAARRAAGSSLRGVLFLLFRRSSRARPPRRCASHLVSTEGALHVPHPLQRKPAGFAVALLLAALVAWIAVHRDERLMALPWAVLVGALVGTSPSRRSTMAWLVRLAALALLAGDVAALVGLSRLVAPGIDLGAPACAGLVLAGASAQRFAPRGRPVEQVEALAVYAGPMAAVLVAFSGLAAVHALPVGMRGDLEPSLVLLGVACAGVVLPRPRRRTQIRTMSQATAYWIVALAIGLLGIAGGRVLTPAPRLVDTAMVAAGLLLGGLAPRCVAPRSAWRSWWPPSVRRSSCRPGRPHPRSRARSRSRWRPPLR
jgi:hypothetical protein